MHPLVRVEPGGDLALQLQYFLDHIGQLRLHRGHTPRPVIIQAVHILAELVHLPPRHGLVRRHRPVPGPAAAAVRPGTRFRPPARTGPAARPATWPRPAAPRSRGTRTPPAPAPPAAQPAPP